MLLLATTKKTCCFICLFATQKLKIVFIEPFIGNFAFSTAFFEGRKIGKMAHIESESNTKSIRLVRQQRERPKYEDLRIIGRHSYRLITKRVETGENFTVVLEFMDG